MTIPGATVTFFPGLPSVGVETLAEDVTEVDEVGVGETVAAVVATLSELAVLVASVVGLAVGIGVALEASGELDAGVVPEADGATGFTLGKVTVFGFALSTISRRFLSTSVKVLSLLKPFSSLTSCFTFFIRGTFISVFPSGFMSSSASFLFKVSFSCVEQWTSTLQLFCLFSATKINPVATIIAINVRKLLVQFITNEVEDRSKCGTCTFKGR